MQMDVQEIKCFQHCDKDKNILCFMVPVICPLCGADMTKSQLRIPPYIVDSPFTDARHTSSSLVIKPTMGHFLYDFDNGSNLHIGVTDSNGCVYEFDERGVTIGDNRWGHCLSLNTFVSNYRETFEEEWDKTLQEFAKDVRWRKERYDQNLHNCYDFVLEFLNYFGLAEQFPCLRDRSLFCKEMILPVTVKAGKYISLYRELDKCEIVIKEIS